MGKNSRARRAAKLQERRARAARAAAPEADHGSTEFAPADEEILRGLPLTAALVAAGDGDHGLAQLGRYDELDQSQVDRCLREFLHGLIRTAWARGWAPMDVLQHARRQLDAETEPLLTALIASEHTAYPAGAIDPRWLDQLAGLEIRPPFGDLQLASWAAAQRVSRYLTLHTALVIGGFLQTLPVIARLLPLPGAARTSGRATTPAADSKVLARVRALLAKAEGSDFPDEAEALSAKAQELMAKFSLDHALLESEALGPVGDTSARRIWLETPYVSAKAQLVGVVATANRCRTVSIDELAVVTVVGEELDLQLTELLSTSLLVQANRAMLAAGQHIGRYGESRTRSFRQSFLVAYAQRIGERLRATTVAAQTAVPDAGRLLPVLARREQQVDRLFSELFPQTVQRRVRVTNADGWTAGLTAADLARLDTQPQLRS